MSDLGNDRQIGAMLPRLSTGDVAGRGMGRGVAGER